jgi:hypothetical protein
MNLRHIFLVGGTVVGVGLLSLLWHGCVPVLSNENNAIASGWESLQLLLHTYVHTSFIGMYSEASLRLN